MTPVKLLDGLVGGIRTILVNGRELEMRNAIEFVGGSVTTLRDRIKISLDVLLGMPVSGDAPAVGQTLVFDGTQWTPQYVSHVTPPHNDIEGRDATDAHPASAVSVASPLTGTNVQGALSLVKSRLDNLTADSVTYRPYGGWQNNVQGVLSELERKGHGLLVGRDEADSHPAYAIGLGNNLWNVAYNDPTVNDALNRIYKTFQQAGILP